MANITGTSGNDTLRGTAGNDLIKGLGGNDRIIGGDRNSGSDIIDGGDGNNDVLDYSDVNGFTFEIAFARAGSLAVFKGSSEEFDRSDDTVMNIETIIAPLKIINNGFLFDNDINTRVDIDLSKNRLTYSSDSFGSKTITVKNFQVVFTGDGNARIKGNDLNNRLSGGDGDDITIGSKGNDFLFAGKGKNILDYSNLGSAVSFSPILVNAGTFGSVSILSEEVDKGASGKDRISGFQKIIGTVGKENTINISSKDSPVETLGKIDLNLKTNSLKLSGLTRPRFLDFELYATFEVFNFVNAIGGNFNDTIVGANKSGKLTGGGGSDTITGGNKNDIITGSDSTARGVGEVDTLTGGGGRDKFVLGDKNGAYYVGKGKDDYATITDFNLFQDSIDLGGFKDYSFASGGGNTIELYSGKDVNTRDLIAKIQLAGGIGNRSTNSRSVMGADASLNAITSKIDILSGSSSTADA